MNKAEFDKKYNPAGRGETLMEFMRNEIPDIEKILDAYGDFPRKYSELRHPIFHFYNRLPDNLIKNFDDAEKAFYARLETMPDAKDNSSGNNETKKKKKKPIKVRLIRDSDGTHLTIQNDPAEIIKNPNNKYNLAAIF